MDVFDDDEEEIEEVGEQPQPIFLTYIMADTLFVYGFDENGEWGLIDHVYAKEDSSRVCTEKNEVIAFGGRPASFIKDEEGNLLLQDHVYREW